MKKPFVLALLAACLTVSGCIVRTSPPRHRTVVHTQPRRTTTVRTRRAPARRTTTVRVNGRGNARRTTTRRTRRGTTTRTTTRTRRGGTSTTVRVNR